MSRSPGSDPEPGVEVDEMGTQFIVQLANRPGSLARLARALAVAGVDIRDISGGGAGENAYAVLSTSDDVATRTALRAAGYPFVEGETLIVQVEDRPGGLAAVAEKLAAAGIDIKGVLFVGRSAGIVETAFSVDDVVRARTVLDLA
jgi:hypothetical protein